MKFIKFGVLLFCLFPYLATAQQLDSRGTEFWVAFMENGETLAPDPELSFFLSSEADASVTVEIPSLDMIETIDLTGGVTQRYVVPSSLEVDVFDTVVNEGIRVTSESEISLYGLNRFLESTDAYLAVPTDVIGNEYIVLAFGNSVADFVRSLYMVVATQDATTVTITPSSLDSTASEPFEITLNRGDVYQHRPEPGEDVSGTIISSNFPVSVFGGHQCANIPSPAFGFCDHLVEQLVPTNAWGTRFLTTPLASRQNGDTFRIIASEDDTTVSVGTAEAFTINRGETEELPITAASLISSDKPVLASQFSNSTQFDNVVSDPFMALVPPFEQFLDSYVFATPTEGFRENFVNVVTRTDDIQDLRLNGAAIDANSFNEIAGTTFSFAQLEIGTGNQTLNGALAGITVYGFDDFDSYGYPGGLSVSSVASVENIELADTFEIINDEVCFSASVSDIDNLPLEAIRVDFIIELIEQGFGITDADGIAEFCIAMTDNPDEFTVTASVGGMTQEAVVVEPEPDVDEEDPEQSGGGSSSTSIILLLGALYALRRRYSAQ